MTDPVRVLWVDDSPDLLRVYAKLLERTSDLTMCGTLGSADDLVAEAERLAPDVVVLDLTMPGRNPLSALSELSGVQPGVRTIVFSGYDDEATVRGAADAGAWGLVSKVSQGEPGDVVGAIRQVARGERCFPKPAWAGAVTVRRQTGLSEPR